MVFSSLLFLFVFLTANLIVYFVVPKEKRNKVLLIFSLVFYAWGQEPDTPREVRSSIWCAI